MTDTATPSGASKVFRQSALDRLSSPEQLDQAITVTAARDWLAVAAILAFVGAAVVWSLFGSIPTLVKGSGILLSTGGNVFEASAGGDGSVLEIVPKIGQHVSAGDLVARISQTSLDLTLANANAVVTERKSQLESRKRQIEQFAVSRRQNLEGRRRALDDRIVSADTRAKAVEKQLEVEERMYDQRQITWQKLHESRQDLASARQIALDARSQIFQMEAEDLNSRQADERDVQASTERLAEAERMVAELQLQLRSRERVTAPASGRVTEVKTMVGGRVGAGTPIVSIESGVTGLQLVLYLPPDQGKRVKPGMDVRISPSTVKREEYGTLIGTVLDVSEFPSTTQAMQSTLGNERLVQQFSTRGAPFAARIDLAADPSTPTGYRWSGSQGPPTTISSGTIAEAEVTVREAAPITFIIPLFRKLTGLDR